jgi:hypothetical protein
MRTILKVIVLLGVFSAGVTAGIFWKARRLLAAQPPPPVVASTQPPVKPWPLTTQVVLRSLQSHSFRTDKLRQNSNDDVVWRWLKGSIATYPQNWVRLEIKDNESYGIHLSPIETISPQTLTEYNRELKSKGLPLLKENKRYLPIDVYREDIICPSWEGLIDLEEARLAFFVGMSG